MDYGVFSDESRHTAGRYRSIATVSLPAKLVVEVDGQLTQLLNESGVTEFKWVELQGARARLCALKLIDFFLDHLVARGGRIDVVIWDTQDARHAVKRRDDTKNFERMFFHLHRKLMERRELGAGWHLRPDERVDVDWATIRDCLTAVGRWRKYFEHPLLQDAFSERFFDVKTLRQVDSMDTPLCQLADLFAGMAPYSRDRSDLIKRQLHEAAGQGSLFEEPDPMRLSGRDRERFTVINHLYERSRTHRLGISLRTDGFLRTRDPNRPMNFWHYIPQHDRDRAPTRDG